MSSAATVELGTRQTSVDFPAQAQHCDNGKVGNLNLIFSKWKVAQAQN